MGHVTELDDNAKLLHLIGERLEKGQRVYGHGIQVGDQQYDWLEMALEEMLDGALYLAAEIVRRRGS